MEAPNRAVIDKPGTELLSEAPEELTRGKLRRIGEGVGTIVYASDHWVVKRDRGSSEVVALIVIWKFLRGLGRYLPGGLATRWCERPSRRIRLLRLMTQAVVSILPRTVWFATHIGEVWHLYSTRKARGEELAAKHLSGSPLVPRRIEFPPVRVRVGGWPGWLNVSEAAERVEDTLHQRLADLACAGRYAEVGQWLDRFLALRQAGWRRGLFSMDAHLKNFGVSGDRIVLLDPGGLTDDWAEVESQLSFEEVSAEPHIQLGLGSVLGARPDIAASFNARWKEIVSLEGVRKCWFGAQRSC